MENQEQEFKTLISELEEIILIKAPIVKRKALILENSEFFDIEGFKQNNEELDELRKRYIELRTKIFGIDKTRAIKEIEDAIENKNKLDKNHILDMKETRYCWGPEAWR